MRQENRRPGASGGTDIGTIVKKQREYQALGGTGSLVFRLDVLDKLGLEIRKREDRIREALKADLNKSRFESYMTETGLVLSEISHMKRHLRSYAGKKRHMTPLAQFHGKSFTMREPYGVVLIMSPWNYPFRLCIEPLVGAIAAGNCCVLNNA